jgi:hypothetical protein
LVVNGKTDIMNRRILLLVLILIVSGGIHSCKKTSAGTTRLGKYVVYGGCGHSVIQLLDVTAADSGVVTPSWTDTSTNITYTNVFGVSNICTFAPATVADTLEVGDEFYFTLNGPVPDVICFMCAIWPYAMPAASNSVTNIRLVTPQ